MEIKIRLKYDQKVYPIAIELFSAYYLDDMRQYDIIIDKKVYTECTDELRQHQENAKLLTLLKYGTINIAEISDIIKNQK